MMRAWRGHLRDAVRAVKKTPAFAGIAVLTLGIGIAATNAIFTIVDAVLIRVPFREPGRLVTFIAFDPAQDLPWEVSYAEIRNWSDANHTLDGVAGVSSTNWSSILEGDPPLQVEYAAVSGTFFHVLAAPPLIGRTLSANDDRPEAPRIAVLSYPLWRDRFGSDRGALGRAIRLNRTSYTIVGVMPPGFLYPTGAQLWTAVAPELAEAGRRDHQDYVNAPWFGVLSGVGRLKSTATRSEAESDLSALIHRENIPHARVRVSAMADAYFGRVRWALMAALGGAVVLLAAACLSVGGTLLARVAQRRQEWAVRLAVGASKSDLVGLALSEVFVLGTAATGVGVLAAPLLTKAILALDPSGFLAAYPLRVDVSVVSLCMATTAVTLLLAGAGPALYASAIEPIEGLAKWLRRGRRDTRGRRVLLAAQVALTVLLVAATGVMVRSVVHVGAIDFGFDPDRLLLITGAGPPGATPVQADRTMNDLLGLIRELPEVRQASAVYRAPLRGPIGLDGQVLVEGDPIERDSYARHPQVNDESVTPGYFSTMSIPIVAGRDFNDDDRVDRSPVVIISKSLARQLWPGEDAIGRRLLAGFRSAPSRDAGDLLIWDTVVGVAGDVRYRDLDRSRFDVYRPAAQADAPPHDLVVRASGDPVQLVGRLNTLIRRRSPQAAPNIRTMSSMIGDLTATWRMTLTVFGAFAVFALLLAAIGLYGWMSYLVQQRTHEIGIRIALGATTVDVLRVLLASVAGIVGIGAGVGTGMFFAAGSILDSLVFDVSSRDPASLVSGTAVVAMMGIVAVFWPVVHAALIDPSDALRVE